MDCGQLPSAICLWGHRVTMRPRLAAWLQTPVTFPAQLHGLPGRVSVLTWVACGALCSHQADNRLIYVASATPFIAL